MINKRKKTLQEQKADQSLTEKVMKKSKKIDKPFVVESRRIGKPTHEMFKFLCEWHGYKKFATQEEADKYIEKKLRSEYHFMKDKTEYRVTDTRKIE